MPNYGFGTVTAATVNTPNTPGNGTAPIAVADKPTGGSLGAQTATVDINSAINIAQSTPNQTISIPTPSTLTYPRLVNITNTGSVAFNINDTTIGVGRSAMFLWQGSAWVDTQSEDSLVTLTADATLTKYNTFVEIDTTAGAVTVTIPSGLTAGKKIYVVWVAGPATNAATVTSAGNTLIDFDGTAKASVVLNALNTTTSWVNGSTHWQLI